MTNDTHDSGPRHSFGGRTFDRYIYDFETDPLAGAADPGGTVAPEAPAEGAAVEPTPADTPAEPAATEWTPPASEEEYEQALQAKAEEAYREAFGLTGGNDPYADLGALGQPGQPQPQAAAPGEPFGANGAQPQAEPQFPEFGDPDMQRQVDQYIEQKFEARMAEIEPALGLIAERTSKEMTGEFLDGLKPTLGEFDTQHAASIAAGLMQSGTDPQHALYQAATQARDHDKQIAEKAVADYKARFEAVQTASAEPGVTGAASEVTGDDSLGWDDVGDSFLSNRHPVNTAG